MKDFKLFGWCFNCKKLGRRKFFVRKRKLMLPNNVSALSRELFCSSCFAMLQEAYERGIIKE